METVRSVTYVGRARPPADLQPILARLQRVKAVGNGKYEASCPFHDDRDPSFQLWPSGYGKCYGPCQAKAPDGWKWRELLVKLGLPLPDAYRIGRTTVYQYRDESGAPLYEVVRRIKPDGQWATSQRRPDPNKRAAYLKDMRGVRLVLYRLPELLAGPPEAPVYLVEGEGKVEELRLHGFIATTSAMGAKSWLKGRYAPTLAGRRVLILPDNDASGRAYARDIARSLQGVASDIRLLELPDLPPHGDIIDWFAAGGTAEELRGFAEAAPPVLWDQPGPDPLAKPEALLLGAPSLAPPSSVPVNGVSSEAIYEGNRYLLLCQRIRRDLLAHGFFVKADGQYFYFDQADRVLCKIGGLDLARIVLERYCVNPAETLYKNLLPVLETEAAARGKEARLRQWSYYDAGRNLLYLDMGQGRVLRLDGREAREVHNGDEGVVFIPIPGAEPWAYKPDASPGILTRMIDTLNFTVEEGAVYEVVEQKLLALIWHLALAFESILPTKPIALAVGDAGSGKTSMFRRTGLMLFGSQFEVDTLDTEKADDFKTAVSNLAYIVYDNVDAYIKWLNDALSRSATGSRFSKRELHTTNRLAVFQMRAFLALTARTPRFRRPDVAQRLLIFSFDPLRTKRAESALQAETLQARNLLLSDYARLLNKVLGTPPPAGDTSEVRLADFALLALRIGAALDRAEQTARVLAKLPRAQASFVVEENAFYAALNAWVLERPVRGGIIIPNEGAWVPVADLLRDLQVTAARIGVRLDVATTTALTRRLRELKDILGLHFRIEHVRRNTGSGYEIRRFE